MKVSFEGMGEMIASFINSTTAPADAGQPVKMSANGTVAKAASGDTFIGIATNASDDFAAVRLKGYTKLSYSATAPTVGFATLVADGSGGVKTAATGTSALVLDIDTDAKTVGFIL